jgi:hypothetical protein
MEQRHLDQAHRTISTWAFKLIVLHHLSAGLPLSAIRMQDVEAKIMEDIKGGVDLDTTIQGYTPELIAWSGLTGITYREVAERLELAVQDCTYFAPSLSGLIRPDYDLLQYFDHPRLVDNSFAAGWTDLDRQEILDAAHTVLVIHTNPLVGDHFQRTLTYHRAGYLQLSSWQQADAVIEAAKKLPHRLVLFAGSAGAKYIGPAIAAESGKVVLDVGLQMERWIPRQS